MARPSDRRTVLCFHRPLLAFPEAQRRWHRPRPMRVRPNAPHRDGTRRVDLLAVGRRVLSLVSTSVVAGEDVKGETEAKVLLHFPGVARPEEGGEVALALLLGHGLDLPATSTA